VLLWNQLGSDGPLRVTVALTVVPVACLAAIAVLWRDIARRLLHPPDLGSEGKEVVDLETEAREAVGLYIKRDEFPDRLFAPPKRTSFLEEGANPIYDKEMRSEIFSQGTLMLRLVIQISMGLAIPIMAVCLYIWPVYAPWYISYVILFNMLVGPVFSAGSVTSERERQTLDLLLVTLLSPWQMLWGKLLSGLRVSSVLTSFLLWPVILACLMQKLFWGNLLTIVGYLLIVGLCCVTTAMTALFCSTVAHKTSTSLLSTYLVILVMFTAPLAAAFFASTFFSNVDSAQDVAWLGVLSPFAATFALPLDAAQTNEAGVVTDSVSAGDLPLFFGYVGTTLLYNSALLVLITWMFRVRWRVSE
jgi:ABC-type transport system involved in multi-copper enzyme maturation permease subunit